MDKQQGYLLIIGSILLIIVAAALAGFAAIVTSSSRATTQGMQSTQAFYIAEGGLEKAKYDLENGNLQCPETAGNTTTSSNTLGEGEYEIIINFFNPTNSNLSNNIGPTSSTIPIDQNINDFAPSGRAQIDNEIIQYGARKEDNASCNNNPPCLVGAVRGVKSTIPSFHVNGTSVQQDQHFIWSYGYIPNKSNPKAKRVLGTAINSFADIIAVGNSSLNYLIHKACGGWQSEPLGITYSGNIQDIYCSKSVERKCFAVGDDPGKVLYWDGESWRVHNTGYSASLKAIDCSSDTHCKAVGDDTNNVLNWTGGTNWSSGSWSVNSLPSNNATTLNDISCDSDTHCVIVGVGQSSGPPGQNK